ncbi:hypothetical protein ACODYM_28700 [Burkholderia gladioli]|uniref:hypothetical protein n=1 Tax=Burkholderia gladioli TaxID=28095 RepID=UPI003B500AA7
MEIILIDGNSLGWRMYHAMKLKSGEMETQAVFGFVNKIRDIRSKHQGSQIQVLWDGKAQWRFDLYPEYKSNRESDETKKRQRESYKQQRPYISRALNALGVSQLTVSTHEADDMAGYLVAKLSADPKNFVTLMSGDHDWVQLIRANVEWRDMGDLDNVIRPRNLLDKTGFMTPFNLLEGKCLQGDSSDVIEGVGGFGEKKTPETLAEFGSVRNFWRMVDSGELTPKYKIHQRLASPEGRAAFRRNFRLMQLLRVEKPDPSAVQLDKGAFNRERFEDVCLELGFQSIYKTMDNYITPFIGAQK